MRPLTAFDLSGKLAIITGGCGRLGTEFALGLLDAGARIVLLDIKSECDAALKGHAESGTLLVVRTDITDKEAVASAFSTLTATFGTPSILINSGGIDIGPDASAAENGPFEDYPEEAWDRILSSHLKGAFLASQEFIRAVRAGGETQASIINIASIYGIVSPDQSVYEYRRARGEPFYKPVSYSVAKSGILNFTRWLAEYGAPFGIRVNSLVPGGVLDGQDPAFVREYGKRAMLGRMAAKGEFNAAILFLASHAHSSYVTGSTLVVDGGWTAR